jgi:hypothetical protein
MVCGDRSGAYAVSGGGVRNAEPAEFLGAEQLNDERGVWEQYRSLQFGADDAGGFAAGLLTKYSQAAL